MQDKYRFLLSLQMCRNPTSLIPRTGPTGIVLSGTATIVNSEHIQPCLRGLLPVSVSIHPLRLLNRKTKQYIGGTPDRKFWCCCCAGASTKDARIGYVWRGCSQAIYRAINNTQTSA